MACLSQALRSCSSTSVRSFRGGALLGSTRLTSRLGARQGGPSTSLGARAFKEDSTPGAQLEANSKPAARQPIAPSLSSVPVTLNRPVPVDLEKVLGNPGLPRANMSCDREHPAGSEAVERGADGRYYVVGHPSSLTVLQQHVAFWDRDGDGIIWPSDTYAGFRRLGFSVLISAAAVPIIHLAFSLATQRTWLFDPRLPLLMDRMHKAKHGSDSETFDTEGSKDRYFDSVQGRFVPQKFEEMWSKYDKQGKGALTWDEIVAMSEGNRNVGDFFGWTAEKLEWYVTYLLVGKDLEDGQRVITKADARGILDGTLFFRIARELEEQKIQRKGSFDAGFTSKRD